MGYDIIGDIHGHAAKLEALLHKLSYREENGLWGHPDRTAIFVGDFIDRGPEQLRTYEIVRSMTDAGCALAVMGNHEFNAIAFHTPASEGGYLREHSKKNYDQHEAFLIETECDLERRDEIIDWFRELPLWLDLDCVRVVHACWHEELMGHLQPMLRSGNRLNDATLIAASTKGNGSFRADGSARPASREFRSIETLLKGIEVDLPDGGSFRDKDKHERFSVRVEWWRNDQPTYKQGALLPGSSRSVLTDDPLPQIALPGYKGEKPVFIGHYWMTDVPAVLTEKVACVDFSAGKDGPLVAYRWSGEEKLDARNFVAAGCQIV